MKKLILSVHEKHQANRLSGIQEAVGLFSNTLQLLHGSENYITSEVANLLKIFNGTGLQGGQDCCVNLNAKRP